MLEGQLLPPTPQHIPALLYQFVDNLNYKLKRAITEDDHLEVLTYGHYEFVRIHPFTNGNGRTGRLLMNLIALKLGYQPLELYQPQGDSRRAYIEAMRQGDQGSLVLLRSLIKRELRKL